MPYRLIPSSERLSLDEEYVAEREIYKILWSSPEELADELKLSVDDSLAVVKLVARTAIKVIVHADIVREIAGLAGLEVFVFRME